VTDPVLLAQGLGASAGVAEGVLALSASDALLRAARGERVVLVLRDFEPEDGPAVRASVALVTTVGGLTSDAAIVARALGLVCVTGCAGLWVERGDAGLRVVTEGAETRVEAGAWVRVDGTTGRVERLLP